MYGRQFFSHVTRRYHRCPVSGRGLRRPSVAPKPASSGQRPWRDGGRASCASTIPSRRWTAAPRAAPLQGARPRPPLLLSCQRDGGVAPRAASLQGALLRHPQLCTGDGRLHYAPHHHRGHSQYPRCRRLIQEMDTWYHVLHHCKCCMSQ